ncbi:mitofilin family membrane protein [Hoeflea sp. YIM 152468]|uniref:COG4223 family protein n=1 Tax=Hoeflea sp. YIM 152468 TaxID=3031759 RepID=UPI0023DA182E|nr:mitofilin family membrane protein [Hoeflea sp. YIM 152468]MDF1608221.1 mitofilin family membrane protein [Hoeflea sp. YIM 152468]
MSKGPTPRHSKPSKPVVIDLDATDVTPKSEDLKPKSSATGPAVKASADSAGPSKAAGARAAGTAAPGKSAGGKAGPAAKGDDGTAAMQAKAAGDATSTAEPTSASVADETKTPDPKTRRPDAAPATAGAAPRSRLTGPERKTGNGVGMVAAGVIGAVIALGGGYALQAGGILPAPASGGGEVDVLTAKVDAISGDVQTLASQVTGFTQTGGAEIPAELTARIDALESSLSAAGTGEAGADRAVLDQLSERIAGLEARIAEIGDAGTGAAIDPAITTDLNAMRAAQAGLEASAGELRADLEAVSGQVADLDTVQQQLMQQIEAPSRQIDLARAIAASGLKSAIDRGGSFMTELEAFASVAPDDPAVAELRDMAARGVPSRSDLVAGFSDAAATAIAAAEPVDPQAGLVDRLMSSAMSVVKVRKVGDVEGDSAEAIAARAETRLLNGDIDAAVAEWNALPEASRAATAGFGEALAARARAEKLIAAAVAPPGPAAASPAPPEAPAN